MKEIFINRVNELNQIEKIFEDKTNRVAIILGQGGIGKTRFLEEIIKRVPYYNECQVFFRLDFDEYLPQRKISEFFNYKFLNAIRLINPTLIETYDIEILLQSPQTFMRLINRTTNQRKVFLFDTVEKLRNPQLKRELFSRLNEIDNAVFIFAGREPTEEDQYAFQDFEEQVKLIDKEYKNPIILNKFSKENAKEYLKAKQFLIGVDISASLVDQLINLTDGIPILMDLAVDYVVREIDLDELLEKDFKNFREELVQYIKFLSTPLDLLVLILALVSPLSADAIANILDVSKTESENLMVDANRLSFIKILPDERIKLHDEMEKLVVQFVWQSENQNIRPSEKFAEETLLKASEYFEEIDNQLDQKRKTIEDKTGTENKKWEYLVELKTIEQEREFITGLWLAYGLDVNREGIWNKWNELYSKVRGGKKYEFAEQILKLALKAPIGVSDKRPYIERLSTDKLIDYKLKHVTTQRDNGNLSIAKQELEDMLVIYKNDKDISATILNQLGAADRDLGNYEDALMHQQSCLDIISVAKVKDWWAIANVENQIGFLYRLLEDKQNHALDQAEKHFSAAIYALSEHKRTVLEKGQKTEVSEEQKRIGMLSATIITNLGYIEGLKKNYEGAYDLLNSGISKWIEAGREREIARAETAMGILKRDEARLDESIELFKDAIDRLQYPDDTAQMSISYFHYGWTQWFKAEEVGLNNPEGIEILNKAKQILEDALEFSNQAELDREKPGILHQLATVTWRLGFHTSNKNLMTDARQINMQAISESTRLNNMHYLIDAFTGEAEFDLDILDGTKINEYYNKVLSFEKDYPQFILFYGRIRRIRGDFYFLADKAYNYAIEMYAQAIPLINFHRGYGPFHIHAELEGIFEKITLLEKTEAELFIRELRTKWSTYYDNNKSGAIDVISWCDNKILKLQINNLSL